MLLRNGAKVIRTVLSSGKREVKRTNTWRRYLSINKLSVIIYDVVICDQLDCLIVKYLLVSLTFDTEDRLMRLVQSSYGTMEVH